MNKEKKKLWTDALRSQRYVQGRGQLEYNGTYCCLGVLCRLAIENGCQIRRVEDTILLTKFRYDGKGDYLPDQVMEWAGMESGDCNIQGILINMNDSGKSFTEIADYIDSSTL